MTFKELTIDYVKDKIPDNEIILMGSHNMTEETTRNSESIAIKKKIIIEWIEMKENEE